jgi:membrane-associated phospholipid phosphatase
MLKKFRPFIILFYALAAIALVAAAFVDLKLDIALNNPQSPFARWFEAMGEMPARLVFPLAGTLVFYLADKKPLKLFGLVANIGGSAFFGQHVARYLFIEDNNLVFGILFGLSFGGLALIIGQYIKVDGDMRKLLLIIALTGIAVTLIQSGVIESVKFIWGRVRFRDLLKDGSYDRFTAWYHPNGLNGNKSFPSGHTASAATAYLMMLLPYASKNWKKYYYVCFLMPFVHTSVVAYTRLVMGAHYLSDVTMGGSVCFALVLIAMYVLEKKYIKVQE